MRLWEAEEPIMPKLEITRECETVGYVIEGSAVLHLEGQMVLLEPGAPGWCQKALCTPTRSLNPSLLWRRRARRPRSIGGTNPKSDGALA